MGKSKKSSSKVVDDAAPAAVQSVPQPTTKSLKEKGKREPEEDGEKVVGTKKQKVEAGGAVVSEKLTRSLQTSVKKKNETSSSESDDEPKIKPSAKKRKAQSHSSSDDSDSEDESLNKATTPSVKKPSSKTALVKNRKDSNSDTSESSDGGSDESEEPADKPRGSDSEESTDEDTSEDEQSSNHTNQKPKASGKPQNQECGSKTLFVGNLSYNVEPEDVQNLFKEVGTIDAVRISRDADGNSKGFAHVEFATVQDAKKALELNRHHLFGRPMRLSFATERGPYTSCDNGKHNSFQKGGSSEGQRIFVRGFDKSQVEEEMRSALQDHFGSCGEITRISIPADSNSGAVKGIAFVDFEDDDGFKSALELNGSDLGGCTLHVVQAIPKSDSQVGGDGGRGVDWFGWKRGGRGNGQSGGRGKGRSGGRESGGRYDGGRGRGRGRGGSGGGGCVEGVAPNKIDFNRSGKAKKITFTDDD